MYQLNGVRKVFKKNGQVIRALDGVDLMIGEGEFLAVQGPTGQGKSTLLLLLGGLDRPTEGHLTFKGQDLGGLREDELAPLRVKEFGFVFQTFNLIPTLTAHDNVETALVPLVFTQPSASVAPQRHWTSSASATAASTCRPSCLAGSSSGSPSLARS
jgi:putative ABC transport system ATP-binding protein